MVIDLIIVMAELLCKRVLRWGRFGPRPYITPGGGLNLALEQAIERTTPPNCGEPGLSAIAMGIYTILAG